MSSAATEQSWRIAITGIGLVTPLGHTAKKTVARILRGESGVSMRTEAEGGNAAAMVQPFDITAFLKSPKNLKLMSQPVRMALLATREAVDESGLTASGIAAERIGLCAGSGQTGLDYDEFLKSLAIAWEGGKEQDYKFLGGMPSRVIDRYFSLRTLANSGIAAISTEFGAQGPNNNYVQGETASAVALYSGCQDLMDGRCDAAIACGYECMLVPSMLIAARQIGLLSGDGYDTAYFPFRAGRSGIVAGEGAACFVLERADDAVSRGAKIIAMLDGVGLTSQVADENGLTAPAEDICSAAHTALNGATPDFVVARGLGTEADDLAEAAALEDFLPDGIPVTAYKGQTGYVGGATAAVELGIGMLCARRGVVAAVRGLDRLDNRIHLNLVRSDPARLTSAEPRGLFFSSTFSGQVAVIAAHALDCPIH